MSRNVEYFFTTASPWAYLGHAAFMEIAQRHRLDVQFRPMPVRRVFDATGGLPLPQRHPARQRYRLVELQRWRERRGLPLNPQPKHSPFDASIADRIVIALAGQGANPDAFMRRVFAGTWAEERDLGARELLGALLAETGHEPEASMRAAESEAVAALYDANREAAVAMDVFGAPSYVLDGEVFWGQDRLDLLDEALTSGREAFRAG
ncbi:2-hydroxychromene-2-carboxylate isomerase [Salinarimonas soli]|uniref:2-hydroxychromene-2-carboxylate isomerase n=1 Tax=Salinarimonas soli TaxID=1638099 RepID=A0A5B2VZN5_9HYPH|nr:2-hydroxychromene-2-carboxylate isomerase [Salinarimonas soli]KAA2243920.1 2-hydroxychromene-2-carboxylate isomerase [Salinarimonas soli]